MSSVATLQEVFEQGKYGDVVREWNEQDGQILSDPDSAYIVAAAHLRLGDFQRAQEICELIEGPFQNNTNFYAMYAAILRRQGLFERAEIVFKKALDLQPEAKDVRNNYSNLLIDQQRYEEAGNLLKQLLKEDPNYQDAKNNLTRLNELRIALKTNNNVQKRESNTSKDPLDAAFEVEEVVQCGAKVGDRTSSIVELIDKPTQSQYEEADLEMLKLASKQVETKQYKGALDLISKVRKRRGAKPGIYKIASDAFIGLELFSRAELMALNALALGEETVANFVNLSSLAAMRNDQMMSKVWLEKARKIDPNNNAIKECEDMLFPKGNTRGEDNPLKIE